MSKDRDVQKRLAKYGTGLPNKARLMMGTGSYGTPIIRGRLSTVRIGKYCSIADNVTFDAGEHHNTGNISTYPFNIIFADQVEDNGSHPVTKGDIYVGNDVWIASGAYVLGGVRIAHGAVIGGRAVVVKDVPPYSVVVGNPGRVVKIRFGPREIDQLLNLKWWNWPREKIIRNADILMSGNVAALLKAK